MHDFVDKAADVVVPEPTPDQLQCDRKWPELDLFLPVHIRPGGSRNNEFLDIFLRSYLLFWPIIRSNTTLTLYFDEELQHTDEFSTAKNGLAQQVERHGHDRNVFRIGEV